MQYRVGHIGCGRELLPRSCGADAHTALAGYALGRFDIYKQHDEDRTYLSNTSLHDCRD